MFGEECKKTLPVKLERTKVLDENTSYAIETDQLTKVVDNTITGIGQATVYHTIRNPLESAESIKAKQEALREIRTNDKLRQGAIKLLERVQQYENSVRELFNGGFFSDIYDSQKKVRTILTSLPEWSSEMPETESQYLAEIKNTFQRLEGSPIEKLARGPIFRDLRRRAVYGLRELVQNPRLVSPLPFHPFPVKAIATGISVLPAVFLYYYGCSNPNDGATCSWIAPTIWGIVGGKLGKAIGESRDMKNFLIPMMARFRDESESRAAFKAIGSLDELIAYDKFGRDLAHSTIPEVTGLPTHEFSARNLINAVQSKRLPYYVPNDVVFNNGQPLNFLTGPNSGGKTSLGKSIAQAQVLAQAGCYVPADWAKMSVADRIFYQIGMNDTLEDDEGGLGAQFVQTRDILFSSTPRSLVVIDDLIEGTTFEEKTRHTRNQLYGFLCKGPTIVYISHHYELAQEFRDKGIGNYLQVEFDGESPTHKIVSGISTNSHSDLVAKRTRFDEEAIKRHLVDEGYLESKKTLRDVSKYVRPSLQN